MTSELDTKPIQVLNPITGEVLTLDSSTAALGQALGDIREFKSLLDETVRAISGELHARMDQEALYTVHTPGLELRGQSPAPVESWDGVELRTALLELSDAGTLSIDAVDRAVETVVTYKARKAGIVALRKLGGEVEQTIDSLCQRSERERRITVVRG